MTSNDDHADERFEDRLERLQAARSRIDMPSDRERLSWVPGVTERLLDLLEKAGYGSPEALLKEPDADRLATRARVDQAKARAICDGAKRFLEQDWPPVAAAIRKSLTEHKAEAAVEAAKAAESDAAVADAPVAGDDTSPDAPTEAPAGEAAAEQEG